MLIVLTLYRQMPAFYVIYIVNKDRFTNLQNEYVNVKVSKSFNLFYVNVSSKVFELC